MQELLTSLVELLIYIIIKDTSEYQLYGSCLVHQANIKTERRWKNYYRKKNVLNEEVPIFGPKCKGIAGLKHSIPDNVKLR